MSKEIYTVDDFEERLSELTIGTDDVQKLMAFVRRLDDRFKWQAKRLETASSMLGHYVIDECMMVEQ